VSTDDDEIAGVARQLGADVPFPRPADLAADDTPMLPVLVDLLATLEQRERYAPDIVVLLQPTSPLRRAEHIDQAVDLLLAGDADTVVSVVPVPHHFTPWSLMRQEADRLVACGEDTLRRQDKPVLFARNGPAVLALRAQAIRAGRSFYEGITRGLPMSREDSLDIDDPGDLKMAELLLESRLP
jgi:N-acylneuraminate cytidylyltransferase/CMP-N,N'-diacetyllegionaminic acid synthase